MLRFWVRVCAALLCHGKGWLQRLACAVVFHNQVAQSPKEQTGLFQRGNRVGCEQGCGGGGGGGLGEGQQTQLNVGACLKQVPHSKADAQAAKDRHSLYLPLYLCPSHVLGDVIVIIVVVLQLWVKSILKIISFASLHPESFVYVWLNMYVLYVFFISLSTEVLHTVIWFRP